MWDAIATWLRSPLPFWFPKLLVGVEALAFAGSFLWMRFKPAADEEERQANRQSALAVAVMFAVFFPAIVVMVAFRLVVRGPHRLLAAVRARRRATGPEPRP